MKNAEWLPKGRGIGTGSGPLRDHGTRITATGGSVLIWNPRRSSARTRLKLARLVGKPRGSISNEITACGFAFRHYTHYQHTWHATF
jgi:hypothetical protein